MRLQTAILVGLLGLVCVGLVVAQAPFKEYPGMEYNSFPVPPDWNRKAEWTRARLLYPDIYGYPTETPPDFPGFWSMDYPRSDRHLLEGVRRLTRIDARSVEQVVSLDGTNEIYNWPTLYAVEVGHWNLSPEKAAQLREYLLRGGFLMVDDFHADPEWKFFTRGLKQVFPEREPEDIPPNDAIFHTIYDLQQRFQVPGTKVYESKLTWENGDDRLGGTYEQGKTPHWKAIYDDRGRIMVAICHNMDLGDAWENSDDPQYQEKWASLAYRIAMNYFVYDLSH